MSYINHNPMAESVARNLASHFSRLSSSVQRLSSGLRVNCAADDASGLAIRDLMRADAAGLHQGARNANDAISMAQVADGALSIIDEKLIRMKELAEQAATGTYSSTQRLMLESEYQAMAAEITRIARATDFNGARLLDGSLVGQHDGSGLSSAGRMKIHFGPGNDSAEDYYYIEIGDCTADALGVGNTADLPYYDYTRNEAMVTEHKTFTPAPSYAIYTDPESGRTFYSDGKYYFSDVADPANSALDWAKDTEIIERLRSVQTQEHSFAAYHIYRDKRDGTIYYSRDNGATFTKDPYDPKSGLTGRNRNTDKYFESANSTVKVSTTWKKYEDQDGKFFFSCDGGLTYAPLKDEPGKDVLDWNNPAHKESILALRPVLEARDVPMPRRVDEYSDTYFLPDPANDVDAGNLYYLDKNASPTKYVKDLDDPDGPRNLAGAGASGLLLLPVQPDLGIKVEKYQDADGNACYRNIGGTEAFGIPNGGYFKLGAGNKPEPLPAAVPGALEAVPEKTPSYRYYITYRDRDGIPYYQDTESKKFYRHPDGAKEETRKSILDNLHPDPVTAVGTLQYETYQNVNDAEDKFYMNGDVIYKDFALTVRASDEEVRKFREDIAKGVFQKTDSLLSSDTTYAKYRVKGTKDSYYYSNDGGKTFVSGDWKPAPGIAGDTLEPVYHQPDPHLVATYGTYRAADGTPVYHDDKNDLYFTSLNDPEGSKYDPAAGALDPVPQKGNVPLGRYYKYEDEDNPGKFYYSKYPSIESGKNHGDFLDSKYAGVASSNLPQNLRPVSHGEFSHGITQSYPDHYLVYVDRESGKKYYKDPESGKVIRSPGNPFTADNEETDKGILGRLEPFGAVTKREWYTKALHPTAYTISTQEAAQSALGAINSAIESKDRIRAHLGAMQNRLENTISNLNMQAENLQAAESRVSGTDLATEMTTFVRNQILAQSSAAMLAQANSMPGMMMGLIG